MKVGKQSDRIKHADRVLRYLQQQDRPLSAYDIMEGLRPDGWMVCCGGHDHQTPVFAICDDCGTVTEHIDTDFNHSIASLSKTTGFEPNHSVLEIHGRCGDCNTSVPNS